MQAIISKQYGVEIAQQAGQAHESLIGVDPHPPSGHFSSLSDADEVVDLLNNEIGRRIGSSPSTMGSNKTMVQAILLEQYTQGLYQAFPSGTGGFVIRKTTIDANTYNSAIQKLDALDQTGAGPTIQQIRANMP